MSVAFAGMGGGFYTELKAFCDLMSISPTPWEVQQLRILYRAYLRYQSKKGKGTTNLEIDAADGAGVASLMRGFGAKKRKKNA